MANSSSQRVWVTIAVLAHLIVNLAHGHAHMRLGVGLDAFQNVYVFGVILIAPLVALALSFTRLARAGAWLLFLSMLGSLVFGVLYHYVIISPDNVAHLPVGSARDLFRISAMLLMLTEVFGVVIGVVGIRRSSRPPSLPASGFGRSQ
jgi:hypothetical protein